MENKELINFVEWLIKNEESPKGASFDETVSWINELSQTEDGKETLKRLTKTYKNNMNLFKDGGKLQHLLCLKSGGKGPDCGCNKKIERAQKGTPSIGNIKEMYGFPTADNGMYRIDSLNGNQITPIHEEFTTPNGEVLTRNIYQKDTTVTKNGIPVDDRTGAYNRLFDRYKSQFFDNRYHSGYSDKMKQNGIFQEGGRIFTGPVADIEEYRPKARINNVPVYFSEEDTEFGIPVQGYDLPKGNRFNTVFKFEGSDEVGGVVPYGLLGQEVIYDDAAAQLYNSLDRSRRKWNNDPYYLEKEFQNRANGFIYKPRKK